MIRHRYYVGTQTRDGREVSPEQRARIREIVCWVYGGYTVYRASGAWRDGDTVKVEPSEVYEGLSVSRPMNPRTLASMLATIAEQTTVLWTEETVAGGECRRASDESVMNT